MKILLQLFIYSYSFLLLSMGFANGQSHSLRGIVNEKHLNTPLSSVHIFLENTTFSAISNPKGIFQINNIPDGYYLLIASAEGYLTLRDSIFLEEDMEMNLILSENLQSLPELIVESQTLSLGRMGKDEIPGSVSYISQKELGKYNYTNANDILKQVPGLNIQEEDGFGLRPNIGLRGSGLDRSARITLMEDGVLAAPAPYSSPSAYYFPTVGRMNGVEVLKGSSQIRFGPFTTGGAVNLISTPIPNDFSSKLRLSVGSYGFRNLHAYVGDSYDQFGFLFETFQYSSDGFKELFGGSETGFDKKDYQMKFRINTKPDKNVFQSLSFTFGQTHELANETYLGLTKEDFEVDPYQRYAASQVDNMDANQRRLSAQHFIEIPGWFNIATTVYRNDFERNWYKLQSVRGGRASLYGILSNPENYDLEYQLLYGQIDTDTTSLIVRANNREYYSQGVQTVVDIDFETGDISHDIHISGRLHQDQEDRFQWEDGYSVLNGIMRLLDPGVPGSQANRIETADALASYMHYRVNYGIMTVSSGIRYEKITIARKDYGKIDIERKGLSLNEQENYVEALLPGIGANFSFDKGINVFAGIHKGFAPPGSAKDTKPESSINYELGVRMSQSPVQGSFVLFINDYDNLLGRDNASIGGIGSGNLFNAGTAMSRGIEISLNADLSGDQQRFTIPMNISYTFTDAYFTNSFNSDFDEWGAIRKNDKLPYIPQNQLYTSLGFNSNIASLYFNVRYQGEIRTTPGQGDIADKERVEGFVLMDISSQYTINERLRFDLSVTNLMNNQYAVARRPAGLRPGAPRLINLGLNMIF